MIPRRDPAKRAVVVPQRAELTSWVIMRVTGALLIVLVGGHLAINLMTGHGVHSVDFAFVSGKWASPFWQVWDLLLLLAGLGHGANGMRTVINDYVRGDRARLTWKLVMGVVVAILVALGSLVIFTHDPCPHGAPADLLPSFCG
ncbi:MAG: succinate dehydrogenase, hydrophobic membrane anchor protein [Cellulomonadaceae bacterium]|jgi:succinate dehydrogenase / fumarate reductase membrane anchor subunit|nr:succinate dehydrogenase, hydrophobic membrane anchor protein [Cellulomonadaceae bacterium]